MKGIASVRATRCRTCPTPCADWSELVHVAERACPIGRWKAVAQIPETLHPSAADRPRIRLRPATGTALQRILSRFGLKVSSCSCAGHAAEMDRRGPWWCLTHIPEVSAWLMAEAEKRRLPMRGDWPLGCALLVVSAVVVSIASPLRRLR